MTSTPELLYPADTPMQVLEKMRPFRELMMLYECAMREVSTKFEVLNAEFSVRYNHNPLEAIKTRLKTPLSIAEKLQRNGKPLSVDSIRENLFDVAGVRIICSFPEDIYSLSDMFLRQDDVKLLKRKDYIADPKENGYRSLHLIVEVPIFLTERTLRIPVEVQFRTIAMDFWATLEHKTRYKQNIKDEPFIARRAEDLRRPDRQAGHSDAGNPQIHRAQGMKKRRAESLRAALRHLISWILT